MRLKSTLLLVIGLSWGAGAFAQGSLKVDCSKPATAADKAGCARLADAQQAMAIAHDRLTQTLSGPARDHAMADMTRWRRIAETFCVASAGTEPSAIAEARDCLIERTQARQRRLDSLPRGSDYPFISDYVTIEAGATSSIRFMFVAAYPKLERPGVDNNRANARLSKLANNTIDKYRPRLGEQATDSRGVSFDFDYTLVFATPQLVTVIATHAGYLNSTHTARGIDTTLVDLASGRMLAPADFLTADALASMQPIVREYLRVQFRQRQGFDMTMASDKLAELLRQPGRWIARDDRLEIVFNADEIGPYASDPYTVAFPYKYSSALIRRDGPLASKLP